MTAATTTLADWLLERLAEDEAVARAALDAPDSEWWVDPRKQRVVRGDPSTRAPIAEAIGWQVAAHIARHDPARVLREVAAKRAIVEAHGVQVMPGSFQYRPARCNTCADWENGDHDGPLLVDLPCPTLRALASVYAGAPGWQELWAL